MVFTPSTLAALVIAASFAAGLNVYATILTLGLLARAHWVVLPPGLEALSAWWIIGASGALFSAEFIADKIPGLDLVWSALHTFVRIPIAALLAYRATTQLSPSMTAARAIITPSPEPISNIAFSTGEDVVAVGITWLATSHPWAAAAAALVLTVLAVFMLRWIVRSLRQLWRRWSPAAAR